MQDWQRRFLFKIVPFKLKLAPGVLHIWRQWAMILLSSCETTGTAGGFSKVQAPTPTLNRPQEASLTALPQQCQLPCVFFLPV